MNLPGAQEWGRGDRNRTLFVHLLKIRSFIGSYRTVSHGRCIPGAHRAKPDGEGQNRCWCWILQQYWEWGLGLQELVGQLWDNLRQQWGGWDPNSNPVLQNRGYICLEHSYTSFHRQFSRVLTWSSQDGIDEDPFSQTPPWLSRPAVR